MMSETYENFMIFGLESTGEKQKLDISEDMFRLNNGQNVLDPNQVLIIVKEEIRRIYIWKGVNSHVRKKFIASRIAAELQNDLVVNSHFHRCKIISVDQGDEPNDFMRAFNFKIAEVPEILERDSTEFKQLHMSSLKESAETDDKKVHGWHGSPPTLDGSVKDTVKDAVKSTQIVKKKVYDIVPKHITPKHITPKHIAPKPKQSIKPPKLDNKKVIDKIMKNKVPANFKRQNLILGNFQIYGATVKKAKVFGKEIEETEWEPVKSIPKGPIELKDRTIRLYVDINSGSIEGIDILQKFDTPQVEEKVREKKEEIDYNFWTVKKLKLYCKKNNITVPTSYRKAQIINLVRVGPPQEITEQSLYYNKWTVKQLKEYCIENDLKVLASYRKADLVKLVKEHKKLK